MPRHLLEFLQQCGIHPSRAKLCYELVVVNRKLLSVARDGALHLPGRDDLVVLRC